MNQELAVAKKRQYASTQEFYSASLKLAPNTTKLLGSGQLVTNIRSASDYSYSSSTYAIPYARVVGDAGCFIDPFFSSGVHLAFAGALSAATTICAAIRGHCNEESAAKWHSQKVADGYERFTLVVLSGYRQIRKQQEPVLADFDEDNFDRAFAFFRPSEYFKSEQTVHLI
jgi:flavin-dependent dehydrogenase